MAGCKVDAQASPQFNQLLGYWKKSGYPSIDTDLAEAFQAISQDVEANYCREMPRFSQVVGDFVLRKYRQRNSAARKGARGGWRIIALHDEEKGILYPIIVYPKQEWTDATKEIVEESVKQIIAVLIAAQSALLGATQMERIITCQEAVCHKSFRVLGPGKPSDYTDVPDVQVDAPCPYCEAPNRVTWPQGVKFVTAHNV